MPLPEILVRRQALLEIGQWGPIPRSIPGARRTDKHEQ